MPKLTSQGYKFLLAADCMLQYQLRLLAPSQDDYWRFLLEIDKAVENAVCDHGVRDELTNRFSHYALCGLQICLYNEHPSREAFREAVLESLNSEGGAADTNRGLVNEIQAQETRHARALVASAALAADVDRATLERVVDELYAQLHSDLPCINPAWLIDLSLMTMLTREPEAAIKILAEGFRRGALYSGTVVATPQQPGSHHLLERLTLQKEFESIAIGAWASDINAGSTPDAPEMQPVPPTKALRISDFRLNSGRRALQQFLDFADSDKDIVWLLPRGPGSDFADQLSFAVQELELVLFSNESAASCRPVKNDKVRSILAAHQIARLRAAHEHDHAVFYGGDEYRDSIVSEVAMRLQSEYGFPCTPRAIYRVYLANRDELFGRQMARWSSHLKKHNRAMSTWYRLQASSSDPAASGA